jgi:hypothetical protein
MTVSLDVLLGTLVFVLPGFVAVGIYVALGRFFSRPDLTRSTVVLLALSLSVPIVLAFNALVRLCPSVLIVPISVPEAKADYVAPAFLFSLSLLYAICALLGVVVAAGFNWRNRRRQARDGFCHQLRRHDVWTTVVGSRQRTPYVLAVLEKSAYHGLLREATTEADDPYIFLAKPDFLPLNKSQRPDWGHRSSLNVDGILLKKDDVKALWFVS